jgi:YVTN family beta-propeller protein
VLAELLSLRVLCAFVLVPSIGAQTLEKPVRAVTDPGVIATRQSLTPAGVQAVFQGRVYGVAFGRSSEEVWALTNGAVFRMDWRSNRLLARIRYEGSAGLAGIRYDASSGRALVSGSSKGAVRLYSIGVAAEQIGGDLPGALAGSLAFRGKLALVPVVSHNRVGVIDVAARTMSTIDTGKAPFAAAINAAGTIAYVSNWGGRVPAAQDLTAATGNLPGSDRVVVDARGIASTGTLTRIDLAQGRVTHTIAVGLHPTALAWDESRGRLYVANGNDDSLSVIDTEQQRVASVVPLQPFERKLAGVAPTALALSQDGTRLYVACGGLNAVAVVHVPDGKMLGLIPTAWYPNGVALSADGRYLAVSTLLGVGSGWRGDPARRYVHANRGTVHVLPVPDEGDLASYTASVAENNHLNLGSAPAPAANRRPVAIPQRSGEPSLIQHVVFIIEENRTYDQVFGDIPKGNGDPSLVMYGAAVTPNQHRLADRFVLLDNFYAAGGNSGDGHQWLTQANETDYCLWPGYIGRSYPFDGTDPIAYAKAGFIWDAALRMKKTVRVYGEYAGRLSDDLPGPRAELLQRWKAGELFTREWNIQAPLPPLNAILAKNYPSFSTAIPDVIRARIFLEDLAQWQREGRMPNLTIVQLPSNHTRGTRPGFSSPKAMVADNDFALGQIVEALTKTPFWEKMAIFVVEDDAQDGVDHVDGHRTVALAISPYVRREYVDSTMYSHLSMLKTIELVLGLPSLSLFDLTANSMRASFTDEPDFSQYEAQTPEQSLFEINPPLKALRGEALRAARDSMRMRFEVPDAAPTARLNRILWNDARGWQTPYPRPRQAAFAPLTLDLDDKER